MFSNSSEYYSRPQEKLKTMGVNKVYYKQCENGE